VGPIGREGARILCFLLLSAIASTGVYSSPSPASAGSDSPPEVPAVSARFVFTLIPHEGQPVTYGGTFYRYQDTVRFEPDTAPGKDTEIQLIDAEHQLFYRIFPQEKIYFEQRLTPAQRYKAVQEGWVRPPESWREEKVRLKEDSWEGHPADLYFQTRTLSASKASAAQKDYSFVWLERESNIPLRLAYVDAQSHPIIVEFRSLKVAPMDPRLFRPPSDYSSLNPY